jgi:hypothetical protein
MFRECSAMNTAASAFVHGFSKAVLQSPKLFFTPIVEVFRLVGRGIARLQRDGNPR